MPRGLSVVLTQSGGGWSIRRHHDVAPRPAPRGVSHVLRLQHGGADVPRLVWDEAIDMWYELSADPPTPRSRRASARHRERALGGGGGLDRRAYDEGARMIQAVATEMGGRARMVASCGTCTPGARSTRSRRGTCGRDPGLERPGLPERFRLWLYTSPAPRQRPRPSAWEWLHRVDVHAAELATGSGPELESRFKT